MPLPKQVDTSQVDTSRPHAARIYDYLLGGHDHFGVDAQTAEQAMLAIPTARTSARENRAFLGRAVRFLAADAGIRQFLDIGAGLPSAGNVHEVAQAVAPESRVVYVDNDPLVLVHAQVLLAGASQGRSGYIEADLRDPAEILAHPLVTGILEFRRPVALMLVGMLHFVPDEANPAQAVATLLGALPPGSYLAASHGSPEYNPEGSAAWTRTYRAGGVPFQLRTAEEFTHLAFGGLELVDPGLVAVSDWRPDGPGPRPLPAEVGIIGAVARKP